MKRSSILTFTFCLILFLKTTPVFQQQHQQQQNEQQQQNDYFKREHSITKPYGGAHFDFIGSTIVTNKFIRLTADSQSLQGALWNNVPLEMTDWEVQVQFHVHGHGKDLFGDGLIMWYARDPKVLGPVFGSKDYFHGLAIILDTYSNHNGPHNHPHPYISAMVNNGTLHYDHDKDGTHTELAGCEAPFRNRDYDTHIAVRYHQYKLTVSTDIDNKNSWKECFSVENVRLPTRYYLGFSAATGDLSDNHDIISVKTYQLESARKFETFIDHSKIEPMAASFAPPREHHDDDKPSVVWTVFKYMFIIVFAIALVGVVLGAGYYWYNRQKNTKKRFY